LRSLDTEKRITVKEKALKSTENESLNRFSVELFQLEDALERNGLLCMLEI
jgi:hypothetical protein